MSQKLKTIIFLGIICLTAIITGIIILQKTSEPQSEEYNSPALKTSEQRNRPTPTPVKTKTTK